MDDAAVRRSLAQYLLSEPPAPQQLLDAPPGATHQAGTSHYEQMGSAGREGLNYMLLGAPAAFHRGDSLGQFLMDAGRGVVGGALMPIEPFVPANSAVEIEDLAAANPYVALPASMAPWFGVGPAMQAISKLSGRAKTALASGGMLLMDAQHTAKGK